MRENAAFTEIPVALMRNSALEESEFNLPGVKNPQALIGFWMPAQ
ncbi:MULTISPECIES: hypothetical protein [Rhizobium/Agrobacterium group]|uniref:Uncharacterized protein n=2 Tax=Neorhizobium TaxID=1525371 RepID=A0ABV0MAF9_9HYPH|nr:MULTISPECIES: hypothetical protein [Rhizobium/Agrobacterium group]WGI66922.1 hypothetical protein QEO92_18140 [Neorhizobium petrolearium]